MIGMLSQLTQFHKEKCSLYSDYVETLFEPAGAGTGVLLKIKTTTRRQNKPSNPSENCESIDSCITSRRKRRRRPEKSQNKRETTVDLNSNDEASEK